MKYAVTGAKSYEGGAVKVTFVKAQGVPAAVTVNVSGEVVETKVSDKGLNWTQVASKVGVIVIPTICGAMVTTCCAPNPESTIGEFTVPAGIAVSEVGAGFH